MKNIKILISILIVSGAIFSQNLEYSMEDYNSTSPTDGLNVWYPEYLNYITLHYFSSQGWSGWTNTFGQLSNFQDELRSQGYENIVIIAVGQSQISQFNSNFCANSDLPLVMDISPDFEIRDEFNGSHKQVVILDVEQNEIGRITLGAGLNSSAQNYITNIIIENYPEEIMLGDINADEIVNIQDIILLINMILNQEVEDAGDVNDDNNVDILDVVILVNIILQS